MSQRIVLKFLSLQTHRNKISNRTIVNGVSKKQTRSRDGRLNDDVLSFIKNRSCLASYVYPSLVNRTIVTIVKVGQARKKKNEKERKKERSGSKQKTQFWKNNSAEIVPRVAIVQGIIISRNLLSPTPFAGPPPFSSAPRPASVSALLLSSPAYTSFLCYVYEPRRIRSKTAPFLPPPPLFIPHPLHAARR